nr:H59 [uncultured bacterium]
MEAEGSVAKVAQLYEIKPRLIRDALAYEQHLGLKKAA